MFATGISAVAPATWHITRGWFGAIGAVLLESGDLGLEIFDLLL